MFRLTREAIERITNLDEMEGVCYMYIFDTAFAIQCKVHAVHAAILRHGELLMILGTPRAE